MRSDWGHCYEQFETYHSIHPEEFYNKSTPERKWLKKPIVENPETDS